MMEWQICQKRLFMHFRCYLISVSYHCVPKKRLAKQISLLLFLFREMATNIFTSSKKMTPQAKEFKQKILVWGENWFRGERRGKARAGVVGRLCLQLRPRPRTGLRVYRAVNNLISDRERPLGRQSPHLSFPQAKRTRSLFFYLFFPFSFFFFSKHGFPLSKRCTFNYKGAFFCCNLFPVQFLCWINPLNVLSFLIYWLQVFGV